MLSSTSKAEPVSVIPDGADGVRANWEGGVLRISWYVAPEDSLEWWNRSLGFCVEIPSSYYGERVAALINELVAELAAIQNKEI